MKNNSRPRPPAGMLLESQSVESLRDLLQLSRSKGLTAREAAADLLRQNVYDWLEDESDSPTPHLRSV